MGAGASMLASDMGLHDVLADAGWAPTLERVAAPDPSLGEVARTFDLLRAHAVAVRGAASRGAFPLVLAGGCISAAATIAGCGAHGVVWLDAHADYDTPENNLSGNLDVMALSIATGRAWQAAAATIPGFRAVREDAVALLYARDLADYQRDAVAASGIHTDAAALPLLGDDLYLHIDLDALDVSVGHANRYAARGGPSLEELLATIDATFACATVRAVALTAYEPEYDRGHRIGALAREIAAHVARRALTQRGTARGRS
ncbi:arginase family protein [Baekduia sp. Peel2402]|uniref:arginase family protein n=1 Tax=Baekduia sp. Peel2402 TaxID=3458296 RepID=UPI00403E4869